MNYKDTPLWNAGLSLDERLDYLLQELTLEEKFACMGTGNPEIERLGLPAFHVGGEAAHGVQARHDQGWDQREADVTTMFPNPIGMSASWDADLVKQAGEITGTEARALYEKEGKGSLSVWAPTIDMERDPRWGRTEEAYGEDPVLTGKMAGAYVEGLQGDDPFYLRVAATLKHFYANNVEDGRIWKSSVIDPRNKWEYYLEPFRQVITEHGAEAVMAAYNEINGVPAMLNPELQKLLKDTWGLHHIVCDGGDVSQTVEHHRYYKEHSDTIAAGLAAGVDCFTDDIEMVSQAAKEAYEQGKITEEDMDRALRCHFATVIRLGLLDADPVSPYRKITMSDALTQEGKEVARKLAAESVVLLKNSSLRSEEEQWETAATDMTGLANDSFSHDRLMDDKTAEANDAAFEDYLVREKEERAYYERILQEGEDVAEERDTLLPLDREQKISVIGPMADVWHMDWYAGRPPYQVSPLAGLRSAWADPDKVSYHSGNQWVHIALTDDRYLGLDADGCVVSTDRQNAETFELEWWDDEQLTLRALTNGKLLTVEDDFAKGQSGVVTASKEEAFGWFVKEVFHFHGQKVDQIAGQQPMGTLSAWNGAALHIDADGMLCVAKRDDQMLDDRIGVAGTTSQHSVEETAGMQVHWQVVTDGMQEAAQMAKEADTVVLCLGAHPMINCKEEIDRKDLRLPFYQQALMETLYAANPQVVLVLVSNVPFGIDWAKTHIPAIVLTATGDMELGNGLADVLTGQVSPAGRLPLTWYSEKETLPCMDDYNIITGGRTYQYFAGTPLYPFGHGLTYSEIKYEDLKVTLQDDQIDVKVQISNQGHCTTDEVVQVYGRKVLSMVKRPQKQLLDFVRVHDIAPGEKREVEFRIPVDRLCYYEVIRERKILEHGLHEIAVGSSSADTPLQEGIQIEGESRGVRKLGQFFAADHYDRMDHGTLVESVPEDPRTDLWLPSGGHSLVRPADEDKKMKLVFGRVEMPEEGDVLLEFEVQEGAEWKITVSVNGMNPQEIRKISDGQAVSEDGLGQKAKADGKSMVAGTMAGDRAQMPFRHEDGSRTPLTMHRVLLEGVSQAAGVMGSLFPTDQNIVTLALEVKGDVALQRLRIVHEL